MRADASASSYDGFCFGAALTKVAHSLHRLNHETPAQKPADGCTSAVVGRELAVGVQNAHPLQKGACRLRAGGVALACLANLNGSLFVRDMPFRRGPRQADGVVGRWLFHMRPMRWRCKQWLVFGVFFRF